MTSCNVIIIHRKDFYIYGYPGNNFKVLIAKYEDMDSYFRGEDVYEISVRPIDGCPRLHAWGLIVPTINRINSCWIFGNLCDFRAKYWPMWAIINPRALGNSGIAELRIIRHLF